MAMQHGCCMNDELRQFEINNAPENLDRSIDNKNKLGPEINILYSPDNKNTGSSECVIT